MSIESYRFKGKKISVQVFSQTSMLIFSRLLSSVSILGQFLTRKLGNISKLRLQYLSCWMCELYLRLLYLHIVLFLLPLFHDSELPKLCCVRCNPSVGNCSMLNRKDSEALSTEAHYDREKNQSIEQLPSHLVSRVEMRALQTQRTQKPLSFSPKISRKF